ncbi:hypothetical protein NON08_06250 [Cetobacterium somerae]|uniref:hypothetical protein n=1 Tax=Cetobacterium sp. NK01 TaxID=2993530 RepID=UPI00211642DD|nr:hypothetical protein [Cetobacterium sp. NK01]MCQ8212124.1 hypothetical protein [Cetobacterium sp. NK01]
MKNLYLKLKKLKTILRNIYSIDQKIKQNLLTIDYEKAILENNFKNILSYEETKEPQIIVSLTTYNKRIYDVHLTIESLFRQTIMPNKIILWLAEDEFNENSIPEMLKRLQKKGLEIGFCKDLKSYKKLIPTLKKYPNQIVITVDDDVIYPYDFLENMYIEYLKDKECVYFYRGHKMTFDKKRKINTYDNWIGDYQGEEKTFLTLPTGIGGVLYPPKCFDKEILDESQFMKLAPRADDIWFKAMTLKNGVKCKKIKLTKEFHKKFINLEDGQDIALCKVNVNENQNNIQLKAVFDYYNLWDKLEGEE